MSDSDRGELSPARLIGTALVAAIGIAAYWAMFYSAGYYSGQHERKANVEAEHYATDAANQIDRECSAKAGQAARECITNIIDAQRESQRGESDLAAQWKAADWVMWAGVIAAAQLLATALGLYFVKRTLDATLEAVEDTGKATVAMERQNEIAAAAQRPWVDLDIEFQFISEMQNGLLLVCNAVLSNIGNTPATDGLVWHVPATSFRNPIFDLQITAQAPFEQIKEGDETMIVLPRGSAKRQIFVHFERHNPHHHFDDGVVPALMLVADYTIPSGERVRSAAWFTVAPKSEIGLVPWDLKGFDPACMSVECHGYITVT